MINYTGTLVATLFANVAVTAYRCGWFRNVFIRFRSTVKSRRGISRAVAPSSRRQSLNEDTRSQNETGTIRSRRVERDDKDDIADESSVASTPSVASTEHLEIGSEVWEEGPKPCFACAKVDGEAEMARRHRILLYFTYLPVYLLAVSADWLQGPYKYAVYSAYGYDQRAIAFLFVAGFGSGMSVGAVIGGLADSWGRKRMACAYCCVYALSCLAKHVRIFAVLLCGRVLGGIAASLLFSVFDAWLIKAHDERNIDKSFLAASFSAANYGSSVVAVVAGLLANALVGREGDHPLQPVFSSEDSAWPRNEVGATRVGADDPRWDFAVLYRGGGIRAFDVALIPLCLCFVLAVFTWEENYGAEKKIGRRRNKNMCSSLGDAMRTVWHSDAIFNLCAVCTFFEGAMYVFIFQWTPALRALDTNHIGGPPLGTVFANFMVCCMLGTSAFSVAISYKVSPHRILVYILALSTASCVIVSVSSSAEISYAAMLLYEACIGAYWPAISTVKAEAVPEDQRAAIYNVFRFPMNLVVLVNLLTNLTFKRSFGLCGIMLAVSTVLMGRLMRSTFGDKRNMVGEEDDLGDAPLIESDEREGSNEYCTGSLTFFDWRRAYYMSRSA